MVKKTKIISKKDKIDPVFIPFDYEGHKENKITVMKAELSVVRCQRIIENLKKLQEQKGRLRRELQHLFSSSLRDFQKTISDMPIVTNTGEIKKIETSSVSADFGEDFSRKLESLSTSGSDTTALGKELSVIQDKLKKLSSYQ